jgi:hemolysin D
MGIKRQALGDLWSRYKVVFAQAWSQRREMDTIPRVPHEYEFLPSTLALRETPVHPAPKVLMRLIVLFMGLVFVWSCFGKLDVVATASGKVVPDSRSKTIQPLETAAVHAIHVRDGQVVQAGDRLIDLDATMAQADIDRLASEYQSAFLDAAMYRALLAMQSAESSSKAAKIELDVNNFPAAIAPDIVSAQKRLAMGQFDAYRSRLLQLNAVIIRHQAELRSSNAIVEKYQQTLPITQQRERDFQRLLTQKYVAQHDYLELKQSLIEQERNLVAETEHSAEISASLLEAEREVKQFAAETRRLWLDRLHESEQRTSSLAQEFIKAGSRGQFMRLTAPVSGTVQQLAVHTIGGVVTEAQPLMIIVPAESPIEVEAYLSNQDIGFVRKGQEVEVKVETFSFTKYGTLEGEVISVSSDAIQDEKLGLVFAVKIKLKNNSIWVDDNKVNLSPGMAVTAEIKTTKRRVIEYFLDPLQRHVSESFDER